MLDELDVAELPALAEFAPSSLVRIASIDLVHAYPSVDKPAGRSLSVASRDTHLVRATDERVPSTCWREHAAGSAVPAKAFLAPLAGVGASAHFLRACCIASEQLGHALVFTAAMPRYVVLYKWQRLGGIVYNVESLLYVLLLTCSSALVVQQRTASLCGGDFGMPLEACDLTLSFELCMAVVALAALFLIREACQMCTGGFVFGWPQLAVLNFGLQLAMAVASMEDSASERARLLAIAGLWPLWIYACYYLRAREGVGQLVRMITAIIIDIRYLVIIVAMLTMPVVLSFYLVFGGREEPDAYDAWGSPPAALAERVYGFLLPEAPPWLQVLRPEAYSDHEALDSEWRGMSGRIDQLERRLLNALHGLKS